MTDQKINLNKKDLDKPVKLTKEKKVILQEFLDKYNKYCQEKDGYEGVDKIILEYDDRLSGVELFDHKKSFIYYKNKDEKDPKVLKEALSILIKHDPMHNNTYKVIGLYCSIVRKLYEAEGGEVNKKNTLESSEYFLDKFKGAYTFSSYFLSRVAMYEKGELKYDELWDAAKKVKTMIRELEEKKENKEERLDSVKALVTYFTNDSVKEQKIEFADGANSSPILKRLEKIKEDHLKKVTEKLIKKAKERSVK